MPLGDFPAGSGLAGLDPVTTSDAITYYPGGSARKYDPTIRDWSSNATGDTAVAHTVDQQMITQIMMAKRSIQSAPSIGNSLSSITHIDPIKHENLVTGMITRATQYLVDSSRVEIVKILVEIDEDVGRTLTAVSYKNLVTGDPVKTITL